MISRDGERWAWYGPPISAIIVILTIINLKLARHQLRTLGDACTTVIIYPLGTER